jgi:hypothetical protein
MEAHRCWAGKRNGATMCDMGMREGVERSDDATRTVLSRGGMTVMAVFVLAMIELVLRISKIRAGNAAESNRFRLLSSLLYDHAAHFKSSRREFFPSSFSDALLFASRMLENTHVSSHYIHGTVASYYTPTNCNFHSRTS